jgi:hypothetical protein
MPINFLVGLPLLCPIGSTRLCFHFQFQELFDFLSYFLYDPLIIEQLFFILQLFEYFLLLLVLLSSSFIALW